ncbi:MAG: hypothetical protein GTO45_19510, partial [Candidatus Aminicenantes bacterium]|nr:hypothetical protein [Candidatus Aminicenantes bacterium]NIM80978.1 hypothetical protein [Candidatus Aminicenantes bacterium]NIN20358.1 hypothetical protein [Candidatus Aminicenantes bacterium]NIN40787.1 hypothetical protein [Candidatus Aminicenantes bacterium]NIN86949.1 hypothetical protein [Candidatus Aminicenantes bacterium]
DYIYSIYANYTPGGGEPTYKYLGYGYTKVFGQTSLSSNIQAVHVTMPENGTIRSLTMYHNSGGSGNNMRLGVYDGGASAPQDLLSEGGTPVATYACWQTIKLDPAVPVMGGTTIWLAWCYDINPGIRIRFCSGGSFQSDSTGCPLLDPFGSGKLKNDIFMIYATYTVD